MAETILMLAEQACHLRHSWTLLSASLVIILLPWNLLYLSFLAVFGNIHMFSVAQFHGKTSQLLEQKKTVGDKLSEAELTEHNVCSLKIMCFKAETVSITCMRERKFFVNLVVLRDALYSFGFLMFCQWFSLTTRSMKICFMVRSVERCYKIRRYQEKWLWDQRKRLTAKPDAANVKVQCIDGQPDYLVDLLFLKLCCM